MDTISKDFIGLWVNAGGYVSRPTEPTNFKVGNKIKTYHFGGSTLAGIGKTPACKRGQYIEYWTTTGLLACQRPKLIKKLSNKTYEKLIRNNWLFYKNDLEGYDMGLGQELTDICHITW